MGDMHGRIVVAIDARAETIAASEVARRNGRDLLDHTLRYARSADVGVNAVLVEDDDRAQAIVEAARRRLADLIVIGARGRGRWSRWLRPGVADAQAVDRRPTRPKEGRKEGNETP